MRERVEQYILRHELISPGDKVLIGLSGGGDSVALLHILKSLCTRLDFTICAAHLNHGIRGKRRKRTRSLCMTFAIFTE